MPLLDHFHPPLRDVRHWEGFHHAWATVIAQQLNDGVLPVEYFAEPEISIGPEFEVDVGTLNQPGGEEGGLAVATATWAPPRPKSAVAVDFAHLDSCEIKVFQDLGNIELRAAIELVSPANKDRPSSRRSFAAKCASYLKHAVSVVVVDMVTSRTANLHAELLKMLDVKSRRTVWQSPTGLYAAAYRPVTARKKPRVEIWSETLAIGKPLPVLPLWLTLDLCVPVRLEESYVATCKSLRISA